ncbi:MAG: KdsC family phosphatase [Mangrovibacterium sp.]
MTFVKDKLLNIKALIFDVDGVLSEDTSPLGLDGVPMRTTNVKDGFAIRNAVSMGLQVAIITGGNTESVRLRYEKVGAQHIYMAAGNKVEVLKSYAAEVGIALEDMLYMGDDLIDLRVMEMVGFPCCPKDACDEVKAVASYISPKKGGRGCARDVIEQVMRAQGIWLNDNAFTWRST